MRELKNEMDKLVQHVSQISVSLIAMKVKIETPKVPIGFVRV